LKPIAVTLLASAVALTGLNQRAAAADLAVKALPPTPVAYPSWTGFYIGVHAGTAWQSTPDWTFSDPFGFFTTASVNGGGNAELGAVGGIQAGYNWQFAPAWVAGLEGDFSWALSLSDHRTTGPLVNALGLAGANVSMSAKTEWLSSVRGRLGFTGWFNNMMLYATGGAAWANVEYAAQTTVGPPLAVAFSNFTASTSFNTIKSGWVFGGGAEWMATTNILLRAEYLYYGINNASTGSAPFFPPVAGTSTAYSWSRDNIQVFRLAGSYKF
jgi:outer membrane immunogenic protein